ncbi:hypothetical protein RQM47_02290 [Rubrivirga sp. S365]|nr:hypothetical protein [Rubrivirga sp. S365]MDT7855466.1 hypothetical protein [Rubrivirga sp. S365]
MPTTRTPGRPVLTLAAAQLRADLRHARSGKRSAGRVATTVIAYGFTGLVLALSLGNAPAAQALFVSVSFGVVLAAFGVVGSYDDLMGRPKENAWLATLPATERQHYGARLVGVGVYTGLMVTGVAVPVALRVALAHGGGAGLAVGAGVAAAVAWTAAAALVVLWSLTLALPPTPLRYALTAARALFIGVLVLGFQLIGTTAEAVDVPWWPGAWLADAILGRSTWGLGVLLATVALFAVLFTAVFPDRYFRLLRRLADGARRAERAGRGGRRLLPFERVAARRGPVRAVYGFALAAFADDRIVRGRLWPAALLPLAFVVFGWLGDGLGSLFVYGTAGLLTDPNTQLHLSVIVVLLFCAQSLVQTLQYSDHAEAAWLFGTLPEARPRLAQIGAQKALMVRVLLPLHVGIAALLVLSMPVADAAVHAAFWFAVVALATRLQAVLYRTPPFSRRSDHFGAAARLAPLLVSAPAGAAVAFLQMWAFVTPGRALAVTAGLLALGAAVAETAVRWPARRTRSPRPQAPAPPRPRAVEAVA